MKNKKRVLIILLILIVIVLLILGTVLVCGGMKNKEINVEDIDEQLVSENLYTAGQPDPDLLIRPGGEKRISNYLLWQLAYTEFLFIDKYWPDFTEKDLDEAIEIFESRNRKFGGK